MIKTKLANYADRLEQVEYTGDVKPRDPFSFLTLGVAIWAFVMLVPFEVARQFLPGWVALAVFVVWFIPSVFVTRFIQARLHRMSVPEYVDYEGKASKEHLRQRDIQRVESAIQSAVRAADRSDYVEFPVERTGKRHTVTIEKVVADDNTEQTKQ